MVRPESASWAEKGHATPRRRVAASSWKQLEQLGSCWQRAHDGQWAPPQWPFVSGKVEAGCAGANRLQLDRSGSVVVNKPDARGTQNATRRAAGKRQDGQDGQDAPALGRDGAWWCVVVRDVPRVCSSLLLRNAHSSSNAPPRQWASAHIPAAHTPAAARASSPNILTHAPSR